jgi:D-glycero-alpha-D-manno-heptose-7-phosphate kinase
MVSPYQLAEEAISVEQNVLKESVGVQDQIMASYGGLRAISLGPNQEPKIEPIILSKNYQKELESSILLGFSGFSRFSNEIAEKKINNMENLDMIQQLKEISDISFSALKLIKSEQEVDKIGDLINKAWLIKRQLVDGLTLPEVDEIYEIGLRNGAIGGKLMGAGGGGFFYFLAPKEKHKQIKKALPQVSVWVPYKIAHEGSKMIYNSSNGLYKI